MSLEHCENCNNTRDTDLETECPCGARKCPQCENGVVAPMTHEEKIKAGLKSNSDIEGCDECSYYDYL